MTKPHNSRDLIAFILLCLFVGNELKILLLDIEDMELYRRELLAKNHVPLYLPIAPSVIRGNGYMDNMPITTPNVFSFEAVFNFRLSNFLYNHFVLCVNF